MLDPKGLRRADLVSGSFISGLGILVLGAAFQMPMGGTYGGVDNPWYASPGTLPLFLGGLFVALGIGVFYQGWRGGGGREFWRVCIGLFADRDLRRRVLVIGGLWFGLVCYAMMLAWKPFAGLALPLARMISPQAHLGFLTDGTGANYWIASAVFLIAFVWIFRGASQVRFSRGAWGGIILGLLFAPLLLGYLFSVHLQVPLP